MSDDAEITPEEIIAECRRRAGYRHAPWTVEIDCDVLHAAADYIEQQLANKDQQQVGDQQMALPKVYESNGDGKMPGPQGWKDVKPNEKGEAKGVGCYSNSLPSFTESDSFGKGNMNKKNP